MTEQAMRKNEGKPQLSYILDAMPALKEMVAVMEFGATKYERNNWQKGFPKDKLLDSLLRHVDAFYSGEDIDPESGKTHVGHILCNAMFLAYHYGSHNLKEEVAGFKITDKVIPKKYPKEFYLGGEDTEESIMAVEEMQEYEGLTGVVINIDEWGVLEVHFGGGYCWHYLPTMLEKAE